MRNMDDFQAPLEAPHAIVLHNFACNCGRQFAQHACARKGKERRREEIMALISHTIAAGNLRNMHSPWGRKEGVVRLDEIAGAGRMEEERERKNG